LKEYREICTRTGEPEEAAWASVELEALDHRLNEHAWDGEWYLRAYRYDGLRFGSKACTEGSIFMNPQVWAVLSGHAQGDRARQVMDSMDRELCTEFGILLCSPPYVSTDPEVCLARLFNRGTKENAGIFNHTQGWAVMAAAEAGMADRAWKYLNNVLPSSFNGKADLREVEPYVVCQSTHSSFSPRFGAGRVSWLSGAAVWNYVAMTQSILGIVPDYDGLRLRPCIPSGWRGFTAERTFRGSRYLIEVEQSGDGDRGLKELRVDGVVVDGNQIPVAEAGSEVKVLVRV
jgi:cellobiose phosphorylase